MSVFYVVGAADAILDQLVDYIELVDSDQYSKPSELFPGGTVGKHIRHTLDHFRGAIMTPTSERIDYDHRARGVDVETNRQSALTEIVTLRSALGNLCESSLTEEVGTTVMCSGDGQCADLQSTRAREIFFALHHAIHHNAILKAIGTELGISLSKEFGTAPSTINYESECGSMVPKHGASRRRA